MAARYLVDGHVHADGLRDLDIETLARFGVRQVLICAHDGGLARPGKPTTLDWLNQLDRLVNVEVARFKRLGVRPLLALGIHPAAAPLHGLEELFHKLPRYLSHPAVVAIGSLGLRTTDERELYTLQRQLEMAHELRRPVIVAGPVRAPDRGLQKLVALLKGTELPPERILVEHVSPRSIPLLHACGFMIALEPSVGRLSIGEVVRSIRRFGADRFVLTSHAGEGAADPLAVPMLAARLRDERLSSAVISRVACENVLRFLGCDDSIRQARVG